MEQLLSYFIEETNRKFDALHGAVSGIETKLDDLTKFKIEMVATARLTALVTSALCGLITLLVTLFVALAK